MTLPRESHHIVVLGGGYAGMTAAIRAAKRTRTLGAQVTLVNAAGAFVERIRLHQAAAGQEIAARPIRGMLSATGVVFVQGRAARLDPQRRLLTVTTEQDTRRITYDSLIYALGSTVDTASVPGVREHAHTLGDESARALQDALPDVAARGGRLVVGGGGLTGIEAASELAEAYPGLRLTLVTREELGAALSERGRAYLLRTFERLGIAVRERAPVARVSAGALELEDGGTVPFDLCLWAGSFMVRPLAREAALAVNGRGQILVDAYLRSVSHPEVYAAGDAAAFVTDPGAPIRMACATAMPMGAHAADTVSGTLRGRPPAPFRFGYVARCISLGRHDGLIQFVHPDDTPKERILTGRAAALVKEQICRYTIWSLGLERRWVGTYRWPKGDPVGPIPHPLWADLSPRPPSLKGRGS